MSTLIVQLPVPPRLGVAVHDATTSSEASPELDWVLSADGQSASRQGRCPLDDLPQADSVIAVLPPQALAWHRVTVPKAPPARLRAALAGLLEESLLDDEADLHLALAPGWKAGAPAWVAALGKPWLAAQIDGLEARGANVERVVPAWAPEGPHAAHLFRAQGETLLAWRDAQGVACLPAADAGARSWLARQTAADEMTWTASPENADLAATWAGGTVAARSDADGLLAAARWDGNLRQFDLAPQHRGSRLAREALRRFWSERSWRPVRWGLLALVLVQLAGINLWAWQQRQALTRQKTAMTGLLQTTFPQVRAVIDAPAQMQKEVDLLRSAAGKPGEADLEPMLYAAEAAWPGSRGPADSLKFEPGRLTITSVGWSPQEVNDFRDRLRPLGMALDAQPGRLTLSRLRTLDGTPAAGPTAGSTVPAGAQGVMPAPAPGGNPPQRPAPLQPQAQLQPADSEPPDPADAPPPGTAPQRAPVGQPLQGNTLRQSAI